MAMLDLYFTVCEILTVEICVTLTLTAGIKYKYTNSKARCHLIFVGNSNVCQIFHRLRDNHVGISHCTRFESVTLKMKVKDDDVLDEN